MSETSTTTHSSLSMALISVDVVALRLHRGQLQVLTGPARHPNATSPRALPAGRIDQEHDQQLEQTARRHISALTSAPPSWLEQVETIGNNQRDSRGWSLTVVYFALLPDSGEHNPDAQWLTIATDALDQTKEENSFPELAYDHQKLLRSAVKRLRSKVQYTTLPLYLLPKTFTLFQP